MRRRGGVCGVCPEASWEPPCTPRSGWEVGFLGHLQKPGMAGCHAAKWRKEELEEENSHFSSRVGVSHRPPAGSSWPRGRGQASNEDLNSSVSISTFFCLGQSGDFFFFLSLINFSTVLVAFLSFSSLALGGCYIVFARFYFVLLRDS